MLTVIIFAVLNFASASDPFVASYFMKDAMGPLVTHAKREELSAANCSGCHMREHQDWMNSRHRVSYTNQNFFEGHIRENQDRCLHCHAPLAEQQKELKREPNIKLAHEGVNCASCHIREGKVFGSVFHGSEKSHALKNPKFCAGCHEFNINGVKDGVIHLTPVNAQDTYSQWLGYKKAGGKKTCQECHMPEGRHLFQGAHAQNVSPLIVTFTSRGVMKISLKGIGHHYPSGDVFRRITLEVKAGSSFEVIRSFTRKYVMEGGFRIASDTTLKPFEPVEVKVKGPFPLRYRFVYHFLRDAEKKYSQIPLLDQEKIIAEGWMR